MWGWKEREEVERVQERYVRWSLGVDWRTPGYMVREGNEEKEVEDVGRGEGVEV